MKDKDIARSYVSIREDYRCDGSIFTKDDARVARIKWVIDNRLTEPERIVILLYVDCKSYRKLGKRLGLSHQTCAKEVRRIKAKIIKEYNRIKEYGTTD